MQLSENFSLLELTKSQTAGSTRIIRVIEHGYTSDSYDAESKY